MTKLKHEYVIRVYPSRFTEHFRRNPTGVGEFSDELLIFQHNY